MRPRKRAPVTGAVRCTPERADRLDSIDVHTHYVPAGWPDLGEGQPWLRIDSERAAMIMVGSTEFRPVVSNAWDAGIRIADMDADGVAKQVVSPTPLFFC